MSSTFAKCETSQTVPKRRFVAHRWWIDQQGSRRCRRERTTTAIAARLVDRDSPWLEPDERRRPHKQDPGHNRYSLVQHPSPLTCQWAAKAKSRERNQRYLQGLVSRIPTVSSRFIRAPNAQAT